MIIWKMVELKWHMDSLLIRIKEKKQLGHQIETWALAFSPLRLFGCPFSSPILCTHTLYIVKQNRIICMKWTFFIFKGTLTSWSYFDFCVGVTNSCRCQKEWITLLTCWWSLQVSFSLRKKENVSTKNMQGHLNNLDPQSKPVFQSKLIWRLEQKLCIWMWP